MIKKVLLSCLVLIIALTSRYSTSFAEGDVSTQAVYSYNCSDTWTVCLNLTTEFGTQSAISSASIYIPYGANVDINGYTFEDSLFNMRFYLVNSSGKIVNSTVLDIGPFDDSRMISWTNTSGGNYKLQAVCFGNSPSYKCHGTIEVSYTRQ